MPHLAPSPSGAADAKHAKLVGGGRRNQVPCSRRPVRRVTMKSSGDRNGESCVHRSYVDEPPALIKGRRYPGPRRGVLNPQHALEDRPVPHESEHRVAGIPTLPGPKFTCWAERQTTRYGQLARPRTLSAHDRPETTSRRQDDDTVVRPIRNNDVATV